jgi:hypothetical protein
MFAVVVTGEAIVYLPAPVPLSVSPVTFTVFELPAVALENVAVAVLKEQVASGGCGLSVQFVIVAVLFPS